MPTSNPEYDILSGFPRKYVQTTCHISPSKRHQFNFIILISKDTMDAQNIEGGETSAAIDFEQHTTAHPTAHPLPHSGSIWRDSAMLG
jgi:hypothetical protein